MAESPHKYDQIAEAMRQEIHRMGAAAHEPFMTDHEAVRRYGASRITIRRAFALLEEEGLVYRVRGRGTMINPNPGKRIRFVAFMGECLVRNGIEPLIIRGVEDQLGPGETNLIICNVENSPRKAMQYARRLVDTAIDGVILTPMLTDSARNEEVVEYLLGKRVPVVVAGRDLEQFAGRIGGAVADNRAGGREIARHFAALGHRRIAFLRTVEFPLCSALRERHAGLREGLAEFGIELDPALSILAGSNDLPLVLRRWMAMPDPPTAVFVENDSTLLRFLEVALAAGIRIPEQLSVAGFDDLAGLPSPIPQTTVHVPHYQIGSMAASQLVDMIRDPSLAPQHTSAPVHLVIRKSTGIAPSLRPKPVAANA